jgi:hypothetical protein
MHLLRIQLFKEFLEYVPTQIKKKSKHILQLCLFYTVKEIDEFFDLEFIVACNTLNW